MNGTTKQPAAAKNIAPSDISSPHELTAFVRLSLIRASLDALIEPWLWTCGSFSVVDFGIGRDVT